MDNAPTLTAIASYLLIESKYQDLEKETNQFKDILLAAKFEAETAKTTVAGLKANLQQLETRNIDDGKLNCF